MASAFSEALVLAMAIGAVAFTVARTKVAESLRRAVKQRSEWFGTLVSCPYCLSHWLSFGAVLIYRPRLVRLIWPLDLLVSAMAIVAVATFVIGLLARSMK